VSLECCRNGIVKSLVERLYVNAYEIDTPQLAKEAELMQKVAVSVAPGMVNLAQTTMDFTTWKKGNKNKLMMIPFKGKFEHEAMIELKLEKPVEMYSIRVGFLAYSVDGESILLSPSSVSIDYCLEDSLVQENVVLEQFKDDGYLMFTVKTFVHNFLSHDKCPTPARAQIIRLRMRRPLVLMA
jgi:hypothetical protein